MSTSASDRTDMLAPVQLTKTAAAAKSTLDYIPSKLGYDTVIPVSILEDRSEFIDKCKPYDIIDGPNPLDELEAPEAAPPLTTTASASSLPQVTKSGRLSGRSIRRSSSSSVKVEKIHDVKHERSDDDKETGGTGAVFTRPSRSGWAREWLSERRPYQLLRSRDIETRVRYVLDDVDYGWCQQHDISPESLQRGVTYLEWAYVSSLIKASMPTLGSFGVSAVTTSSSVVTGIGEGADLSKNSSSPSFSSVAVGKVKRTNPRQENGTTAGDSAEHTCALCSKPVHVLTSHIKTGPVRGGIGNGRVPEGKRGGVGHSSGVFSASSIAGGGLQAGSVGRRGISTPQLPSSLPVTATNGSSANESIRVQSSSLDLHCKGLRCNECGVVAHLRCWFLSEPPRLPESWTCDGCAIGARHRKRSASLCCVCGRTGGVLLAYVSCPPKDDSESPPLHFSNVCAPHASATSAATLSDMVCHAVCALSIPELAVHTQETVSLHNGISDALIRPYVYATRRVGKQRYAMNCAFCQCEGGRCIQCSHPHCFEAMHASCAAEAHTVDCDSELPVVLMATNVRSTSTDTSLEATSLENAIRPVVSGTSIGRYAGSGIGWSSCSPYCRRHYGYSVNNSVNSALLAHKAEEEALSLDLTGLLTGSDGVTSPVVRKRGRGRPPAALVQQREAERDLIEKLRTYWVERREHRRQSSAQLARKINARLRPIVEASLRPEIVKISVEKVRLSHFLSLVPEWQSRLVSIVEGELPLPDEEYEEVQKYRKTAHTRRSGNTRSLYEKMCQCAVQLDILCQVSGVLKRQCEVRRTSVEQELAALRLLSGWQ